MKDAWWGIDELKNKGNVLQIKYTCVYVAMVHGCWLKYKFSLIIAKENNKVTGRIKKKNSRERSQKQNDSGKMVGSLREKLILLLRCYKRKWHAAAPKMMTDQALAWGEESVNNKMKGEQVIA